ncbi:nuclear transport factor 2 family protein [Micromonospora sp. KC721]|uniref:nuclear transport factor 2 family protein n=1 Tax=Micromonospora sp. KC721 TaxID=2530380 RepID=UPI0010513B1F|nr:nuclear transport factor 2 family protein [Micromonospora sp. KC721]TDB80631.1 nuclear transport factor 2 family protein [Micromonospora sp. KC721]
MTAQPQSEVRLATPTTEEYIEVQQFYARHMGLLDDGLAEQWAQTFTEDARFEEPSRMEPLHSRQEIQVSARARADRVAASGERYRHWVGMLDVGARPDGALQVRYYALVLATPRDGKPRIVSSVDCRDLLVRENGRLLVRHRLLRVDGA